MVGVKTAQLPGTSLTVRLLEPSAEVRGLVVLCHGFGAPGTDLVGLAPELNRMRPELAANVAWAFPEAPLTPPELAGFGGRAWWKLDTGRIEQLMRAGRLRDLANDRPEGLAPARRKLRATLDALLLRYGLSTSQMVIGGFSQGAMLTTETALRLEEPPAALITLSGTLLNMEEWTKLAPRRAGLRVLQTHGRSDPLLPFFGAEALRDMLVAAGLEVDFRAFDGEHTIAPVVMHALAETLSSSLTE